MGATKELAMQYSEQESLEEAPVIIEEQDSQYIQLLKRLQAKEETLSYSSLKAFAKSPRNFIQYKLKPRSAQTDSQIFGSLCDCFLTTPEKFDDLFVVVDNVPSTDNQIGFCNSMLAGVSPEEAKKLNNPRGDANDLAAMYKPYCDAVKSGKTSVSTAMKNEATIIIDNLKKSDLVMQFIDSCTSFQTKREWTYSGWKFKGFTDAEGTRLILDFKYSKDADPDKFEREIINYDYFMQMGMYADSDEGLPECYFIVYDKTLNFSVIKVDYTFLSYGIRKYKYLVAKLEDCIKNNRWAESYNFFDVQLRTVYKPKWVKGFETDADNVE